MKHIFKSQYVLAIAVAIVMFAAVGCKQKKPAPTETGFELSMTNADSTAVVQLVDQFFGYAENECYTEAAAMLFTAHTEADSLYLEPEPLNNEQLDKMISKLKALKIKSHHIDYIKFNETYLNEVKCTVFLSEEVEGPNAIRTVFYFKVGRLYGSLETVCDGFSFGRSRCCRSKQARFSDELLRRTDA